MCVLCSMCLCFVVCTTGCKCVHANVCAFACAFVHAGVSLHLWVYANGSVSAHVRVHIVFLRASVSVDVGVAGAAVQLLQGEPRASKERNTVTKNVDLFFC